MQAEPPNGRLTTYTPGPWVAIAGTRAYLLTEPGTNGGTVDGLWEAARSGAELDDLLDTLGEPAASLKRASFGVLYEMDDRWTVVLRGSAIAEIVTNGVAARLACPAEGAMARFELGSPPEAVLMLQGDAEEAVTTAVRLPLAGGVVRASDLSITWEKPGQTDTSIEPAVPSVAAAPVAAPPVGAGRSEDPQPNDHANVLIPESASPGLAPLVAASEETILPVLSERAETESELNPSSASPSIPADAPGGDAGYDHLFGHTISRTVEDAAVRAAESDESQHSASPLDPARDASDDIAEEIPIPAPAEPLRPLPPPESGSFAPPSNASPSSSAVNVAPSSGMIDSVPWGDSSSDIDGPGAPVSAAPRTGRVSTEPTEDPAELTIRRTAQQELIRQMAEQHPLPIVGPTVHAVRCAAGHLNPPHLGSCRICDAEIAEQGPITVARPVLGVLRLSTGGDITLDRSVLIGRSPADRLVDGERPHLVKVPSPGQDISRSHVEVRLDGWHVLVVDLNSTNGTVLTSPGGQPVRLRPDDPMMIEPGTLVSLADEINFVFLAV